MMVSTKGRYALRIMIDLADNGNDKYVSLTDIAERLKLSVKYLEIVVSMLNKGGLVKSRRGKNGGYSLAKGVEEYKVSEIIELTEGSLAPVNCLKPDEEPCKYADTCVSLLVWEGLDKVIAEYLDNITLEDVIKGNV